MMLLHAGKVAHCVPQTTNGGSCYKNELPSKRLFGPSNDGDFWGAASHNNLGNLRSRGGLPALHYLNFHSYPRQHFHVVCKSKHSGGKGKSKQSEIPTSARVSGRSIGGPTSTLSPLSPEIRPQEEKNGSAISYANYQHGYASDDNLQFSVRSDISTNNDLLLSKFSEMKKKVDHLEFGSDFSSSFQYGIESKLSDFVPSEPRLSAEKPPHVVIASASSQPGQNGFTDTETEASDDELYLDMTSEPTWMKKAKESKSVKIDKINEKDDYKMLAAVDMGTNSFHMVVVKADSQGRFQIEDVEKEDVRLGSGSSGFSVITPEAEERALAAIKRLKKIAQNRNAVMRVVATSAVREARNRRMFVRRVFETTGVEVEVLSGREEACLIYEGILQALPVYNKTVLTVDIGGGSTEFVVGRAGKPLFATSLKLGHIRLTERFIGDLPLQRNQIEEMRNHIRVMLSESGVLEVVQNSSFEMAIGSSGTIETLEQMIHANKHAATQQNQDNGFGARPLDLKDGEFTADELSTVVKKICKAKTVEMRSKLPGLPEKRADVIVGGAILLEEIFLAIGIQKMKVSPYALREGVIVDTLARICDAYCPTPNLRRSSVLNLAKKFNTDRRLESAMHSAELAKRILSGLLTCKLGYEGCVSDVANLMDETDFEILESATILHYIGMFISHKGYHKHSHYLIKNNEHLLGFSSMEVEMIALLVKYHRKKLPNSKDPEFTSLPEHVQRKLRALCAVIRVAVALDRCDSGSIADLTLAQDYDTCAIVVTPAVDPSTGKFKDVSLEIWSARAELEYFQKVFKKSASIVVGDAKDFESFGIEPSRVLSS